MNEDTGQTVADGKHHAGGGRRRRGGGEQLMVERASFASYYGRPVIKAPAWEARDIAGYFFLGGLAGAGSVLAAALHAGGAARTATALKVTSVGSVALATAALIHDLGVPSRFTHMLRVVKPTSPMSVGSWLLTVYGPVAGVAAAAAVTGRVPRVGAVATGGAAVLGPAVATYTAVLAADTAVPAWHGAHRELPYVFAGSALAAASGAALLLGPPAETGTARATAVLGAAGESLADHAMRRRLGSVAVTLREGRAGRLLRAARTLTAVGAALAPVAGSRVAGAAAGAALLAGSVCTRFGVFAAGVASAKDPAHTVEPQRARLAAAAAGEEPAVEPG